MCISSTVRWEEATWSVQRVKGIQATAADFSLTLHGLAILSSPVAACTNLNKGTVLLYITAEFSLAILLVVRLSCRPCSSK